MTISTLVYYLFAVVSISYIIHLGYFLIGASLYDIAHQRRRTKLARMSRSSRYQPHVTVLVPAHNEEKVIVRCLDSIFSSTYTSVDVIVVNDASSDRTRDILEGYLLNHPGRWLRIVNMRKNTGKGGALNYALNKYVNSDLVMMVDADSIIAPHAIENAVNYFEDPKIVGVAANVQLMNQHTTLSVLQKFEHMIGYRSKKAYSISNCEFVIGGVASTYRTEAIRAVGFYDTDTMTEDIGLSMKLVAKGNKEHRLVYGADIMALTEPVETLRGLFRQRYRWKYGSIQNLLKHKKLIGDTDPRYSLSLTVYRLPMALVSELGLFLLPVMWAYAVFLTLNEKSLLLILGAYTTVTVYTLMTVWYDEHLRWRERLYLSIYVPVAYFIFYIMDVIQVISILKCASKLRSLGSLQTTGSTWVSPVRLGGEMKVSPVPTPVSTVRIADE